jgi:hypothetical protein
MNISLSYEFSHLLPSLSPVEREREEEKGE